MLYISTQISSDQNSFPGMVSHFILLVINVHLVFSLTLKSIQEFSEQNHNDNKLKVFNLNSMQSYKVNISTHLAFTYLFCHKS